MSNKERLEAIRALRTQEVLRIDPTISEVLATLTMASITVNMLRQTTTSHGIVGAHKVTSYLITRDDDRYNGALAHQERSTMALVTATSIFMKCTNELLYRFIPSMEDAT